MKTRPQKSPAARDLNDLFRDDLLDLDATEDAGVPRLPLADAEDMWIAEVARRPEHLDVTKVTDRHLSAHAKLLLAAVKALHAAQLPIDRTTLEGEIADAAARSLWASWERRGDMPKLDPRSLPRRMRVRDSTGNLEYAEDCLVRSFAEAKYTEALVRAAPLAREHGMAQAQELLRGVEARIEAAQTGVKFKTAHSIARDLIVELRGKLRDGDRSFISSGFGRLDAYTKGWRRKRLTSIGGWPGHGKSTLMLMILVGMALAERDVHYISLEDEAVIPLTRIVMHQMADLKAAARVATLTTADMFTSGYREADVDALERFVEQTVARMRLTIVDDGPWSKEKVRAAIIAAGRSGAEVVAVDYLQALKPPGSQDLTPFYNGCVADWKDAAKSANVHLILGTQLRRAPGRAGERDASKIRPAIDEAAYCPGIEQASEYVILCHRYEKDKAAQGKGDAAKVESARIIKAKAKDGAVGTIACQWCNDRQMYLGL